MRATLGILGGRYYFRVKVLQPLPVPPGLAGPDTGPVHLARVGLSAPHAAIGGLGEERGSFGFGGTGFICAGAASNSETLLATIITWILGPFFFRAACAH